MLEVDILSAVLSSRDTHDKIVKFITIKSYTKEFQHLLKFITDYYKRDPEADHVKVDLLNEQIATVLENEKHVTRFKELVDKANNSDTSNANAEALVLLAKRRELELSIASGLVEGKDVDNQLKDYQSLREAETLDDLDEEVELLETPSVASLLAQRARGNLIPIFPKALNERLDGGCERGDNVLLFGMTEIGKSLMAITNAAGWGRMGLKVLYLINEDKTSRIATRVISCLTGLTRPELEQDPEYADKLARERGFDNIRIIQIIPGNLDIIAKLIEKYEPDCVIVDQLRNLRCDDKNRVIQLEMAATGTRNLGKKYNVLFFNVTQAGDSARNKITLDNGDVDFSNVGIPGQMDLMIGFGANEEMLNKNERCLSICKNKISGDHTNVMVRINPMLSRAYSV